MSQIDLSISEGCPVTWTPSLGWRAVVSPEKLMSSTIKATIAYTAILLICAVCGSWSSPVGFLDWLFNLLALSIQAAIPLLLIAAFLRVILSDNATQKELMFAFISGLFTTLIMATINPSVLGGISFSEHFIHAEFNRFESFLEYGGFEAADGSPILFWELTTEELLELMKSIREDR